MEKLKILNIYKINLYQSLIFMLFMFRVKNNTTRNVFHERFTNINHLCPTRFSQNNFTQRTIKSSRTKFGISSRGPLLGTIHLLPFKSNVSRKIVLRNQLKKLSSNYTMSLIIFEYTS